MGSTLTTATAFEEAFEDGISSGISSVVGEENVNRVYGVGGAVLAGVGVGVVETAFPMD